MAAHPRSDGRWTHRRRVLALIASGHDGEVRHMLAVWYDRQGVNPGDTKKRRGWSGSAMPFPRVIPHSDGAGVIESVGEGVDPARIGQRVWIYGAQSYRPWGTAAQFTVVPDGQALDLPESVTDEVGACLGIPGITAHRAVFGDGSVALLRLPSPRTSISTLP